MKLIEADYLFFSLLCNVSFRLKYCEIFGFFLPGYVRGFFVLNAKKANQPLIGLYSRNLNTRLVRYSNVLLSNGSVVWFVKLDIKL